MKIKKQLSNLRKQKSTKFFVDFYFKKLEPKIVAEELKSIPRLNYAYSDTD